MKKRWIAVMMSTVMLLTAAGCSGGESGTAQAPGTEGSGAAGGATAGNVSVEATGESSKDTLIIANTSGEPGNVHPYNSVSIGASMVQYLIFEGLVSVDTKGEVLPALAESWEVDQEKITFHIRDGVTFHNGEALTVDDVVFSIQEMANSTGGKASNYTACDVENITTPDEKTVVIPLKEDNSGQLSYFGELFIVNKKAYQEMGDQYQYEPVGTGPFKLTDWVVGDVMTLERFDDYWDGAPLLETVKIRTISEVSQALIEVETGGADIMINPDGSDVARVLNGEVGGVKAITEPTLILRNNNVNFNHNSEYMSNKKVREAIAHCIDRESWANIISPGVGVPAYSSVAAGIWGFDETLADNYPYAYDLEAAKACLAEAGYPDGFSCTILTDARTYHQALVELLQASLSQVGIDLKVDTMELAKQKEIMASGEGFDLFLLDNVGRSGDHLSCLWRDSNPEFSGIGGTNYLFYTVEKEGAKEYAECLGKIRACYDDTERLALCKEGQKIFTDNLIWIPVNSIQAYVLATESLQNVTFSGDILRITNKTFFE
ncbi:ABC transporter substrate-binding protein [Hominifimenecus sp. rT4P-3]|uniref:ABC transporter substrate-binding protein n=1 Tax=Hominifimenecus sp. rT4P-3 TaxID=3242979 RepID=UPI003DA3E27F